MRFEVRAMRAQEMVSLFVEATSPEDARTQALNASLKPISVHERGAGLRRAGRRGDFSVLLFSQELLSLLEAGLGIVEAIETLAQKERRPAVASLLARLRLSLVQGMRFSAALESAGEAFPPLYIGVLRAAERTSDLERTLARYIDYETRLAGVRERIVGATVYPAILAIVGILVTLFLGVYVVPRFAAVYHGTGRELPAASAALLAWGSFAARHAVEIAFISLCAAVGAVLLIRNRIARDGWSGLLTRVPGMGERLRTYQLSRLYLTLGMLIEGGLPVLAALELARSSIGGALAARVDDAARLVRDGEALSEAFDRNGLATPVAVRFLRVGEGSGNLGEMLGRSATYHDAEMARWIAMFVRVFEPLLMTAIGIVVGVIVVLLYLPIFELAGSLG